MKFGQIVSIHSQDNEQKEILKSIKGRNSLPNLRKMMCNNPKLDLVNEHTKFGKILFIGSQDIKQKQNSYINQWAITLLREKSSATIPT